MAERRDIDERKLWAAVLGAIAQHVEKEAISSADVLGEGGRAREKEGGLGSDSRKRWRSTLKQPLSQPGLWRSLPWAQRDNA